VKVGELVEITRACSACAKGTIGLIVEKYQSSTGHGNVYTVHLFGKPDRDFARKLQPFRFLGKDLRVIK